MEKYLNILKDVNHENHHVWKKSPGVRKSDAQVKIRRNYVKKRCTTCQKFVHENIYES